MLRSIYLLKSGPPDSITRQFRGWVLSVSLIAISGKLPEILCAPISESTIMKKVTTFILSLGAAISLVPIARSDEIRFTTLPQPVQTTVIRETHIANPSYVTRVVRSDDGIYAVTVRRDTGEQVFYVNPEGAIVQAPSSTTTTTTTTQEPSTTTTRSGACRRGGNL